MEQSLWALNVTGCTAAFIFLGSCVKTSAQMEAPEHIFTKAVTFLSVHNIFHFVAGKLKS